MAESSQVQSTMAYNVLTQGQELRSQSGLPIQTLQYLPTILLRWASSSTPTAA
uniref:Uncharacterized protein n=1 Tax=Cucumis sativus TaxID=3659 RepID=A0A0A0K930_CUCSA